MKGIVPEPIRTRSNKTTFDATFGYELQRQWSTYVTAFGPTARPRIAERGYVDQSRFWLRLQSIRAGVGGPDLTCIMRLVELETWLRSLESPHRRGALIAPRTKPAGRES